MSQFTERAKLKLGNGEFHLPPPYLCLWYFTL